MLSIYFDEGSDDKTFFTEKEDSNTNKIIKKICVVPSYKCVLKVRLVLSLLEYVRLCNILSHFSLLFNIEIIGEKIRIFN